MGKAMSSPEPSHDRVTINLEEKDIDLSATIRELMRRVRESEEVPISDLVHYTLEGILLEAKETGTIETVKELEIGTVALLTAASKAAKSENAHEITPDHLIKGWQGFILPHTVPESPEPMAFCVPVHKCLKRTVIMNTEILRSQLPKSFEEHL